MHEHNFSDLGDSDDLVAGVIKKPHLTEADLDYIIEWAESQETPKNIPPALQIKAEMALITSIARSGMLTFGGQKKLPHEYFAIEIAKGTYPPVGTYATAKSYKNNAGVLHALAFRHDHESAPEITKGLFLLLTLCGADVNAKDHHGLTPCDYATMLGNTLLTGSLREKGGELSRDPKETEALIDSLTRSADTTTPLTTQEPAQGERRLSFQQTTATPGTKRTHRERIHSTPVIPSKKEVEESFVMGRK